MNDDFANSRVSPPDDDDSLREYGRQLAMDNLLELALRRSSPSGLAPIRKAAGDLRRDRAWRKRWLPALAAVLAVSLLLAVGLAKWWRSPKEQPIAKLPPQQHEGHVPDAVPTAQVPPNRMGPPKAVVSLPTITLPSGWIAEPTGTVDCGIIAADRIRLKRGELRIYRSPSPHVGDGLPSITIETPNGTATAKATEFFIGALRPEIR